MCTKDGKGTDIWIWSDEIAATNRTCSSFAQLTQNYLNNNPSSKKAEDQKAYNWTIEKELKIQKFDFIWYWVVL